MDSQDAAGNFNLLCAVCGLMANTRKDCVVLYPDRPVAVIHETCLGRGRRIDCPVWVNRTGTFWFPRLRAARSPRPPDGEREG